MPPSSLPDNLQAWLYITVVFTVKNVHDSLHNVQDNVQNLQDTVQNVQDTAQYCTEICAVLIRKQCSTVHESVKYCTRTGHYVELPGHCEILYGILCNIVLDTSQYLLLSTTEKGTV